MRWKGEQETRTRWAITERLPWHEGHPTIFTRWDERKSVASRVTCVCCFILSVVRNLFSLFSECCFLWGRHDEEKQWTTTNIQMSYPKTLQDCFLISAVHRRQHSLIVRLDSREVGSNNVSHELEEWLVAGGIILWFFFPDQFSCDHLVCWFIRCQWTGLEGRWCNSACPMIVVMDVVVSGVVSMISMLVILSRTMTDVVLTMAMIVSVSSRWGIRNRWGWDQGWDQEDSEQDDVLVHCEYFVEYRCVFGIWENEMVSVPFRRFVERSRRNPGKAVVSRRMRGRWSSRSAWLVWIKDQIFIPFFLSLSSRLSDCLIKPLGSTNLQET